MAGGPGQTVAAPGANPNPVIQQHTTLLGILSLAGFNGQDLDIASGVAWAESTATTGEVNPTPCSPQGDHAVGLMQVCTVNCGKYGLSSDKATCIKQLKNPQTNADAAKGIKDEQGWGAWTTYTNGAWQKFHGKNKVMVNQGAAAGDVLGGAASAVADVVTSPISTIAGIIKALADPSTYLRLGKGLLGAIFIALGVGVLVFIVANKLGGNPGIRKAAEVAAL